MELEFTISWKTTTKSPSVVHDSLFALRKAFAESGIDFQVFAAVPGEPPFEVEDRGSFLRRLEEQS